VPCGRQITMRIWHGLLSLLAAITVVVAVPSSAYACSCVDDSLRDHLQDADVVVQGTIEDRDELGDPFRIIRSSGDKVVYDVSVDRVYKGASGPVTRIHSVVSGASCGLEVRVGGRYILFADRHGADQKLWGNLCGGTAPAEAELVVEFEAAVGGSRPPDPTIGPPPRASAGLPWFAAGGAVVAFGVAAAVAVRRRKRNGTARPLSD
jgi:hypothetical protein